MARDSSPPPKTEAPYSKHSVDNVKVTNSKIVASAKPNTKKEDKEIVYIMNDDDLVETAKKFITQK